MDESHDTRRSGRRRVRPVEFWNFVKPEEVADEAITYNESELSRCSIFKPFSCSYLKSPKRRLSSFKENVTKVSKTADKKDSHSALTVQNAAPSPKPLGRKQRLENVQPHRNVNGHSLSSSPNAAHLSRLPRKTVHQEPTEKTKGSPLSTRHEQTHSSRLTDRNQNLTGQEQSRRNAVSTKMNGEVTGHTPKQAGRRRSSGRLSLPSNDDSTASQKKRGRKRSLESEEPRTDKAGNSLSLAEKLRKKSPRTLAAESPGHGNQQNSTRVGLPPSSTPKRPTASLSNGREHHTRLTYPAKDATNTTARLNFTGRDVTQNTTAYEQPSFQNVLSSTHVEGPGKGVFKVPKLPPFRRTPLPSLKVSSINLEPSMGTIPEEEEEEGEEHQQKERQKNKKQEKEQPQSRKKKEQEQEKQHKSEQKKQEHQTHTQEREEVGQEKEKNEKEEPVQQKKQKPKDGAVKVSVRGAEKASGGGSADNEEATASVMAKTGAVQGEVSQERTSTAVPSQPQGQESRGNPSQEDMRMEVHQNRRQSSRVRMKPLEFWNFEKVEVERQEDGKVQIIHQKQDPVQFSIKTRVVDCSMAHRSQLGHGVTLTTDLLGDALPSKKGKQKKTKETAEDPPNKGKRKISPIRSTSDKISDTHPALSPQVKRKVDAEQIIASWTPERSPAKSPSKKKLFSPQDNFWDKPVEEEGTYKRRMKGGMMVVQFKKFKDMHFMVIEREGYRCYLAQGLQIKDESIYTGFVFLERGQIVWNTTRKTTIYVIEGLGILKGASDDQNAHAYSLKPRDTVQFNNKLKLSMKKDGRCKLLKLHIVLGPHL